MNVCLGRSLCVLLFVAFAIAHGAAWATSAGAGEFTAETTPHNPLRSSPQPRAAAKEVERVTATPPASRSGTAEETEPERVRSTDSAPSPTQKQTSVRRVSYERPGRYQRQGNRRPRLGFMPRHRRMSYQQESDDQQQPAETPEMPLESAEPIQPMERPEEMRFDDLPAEGEFMTPEAADQFMGPGTGPDCMGPHACGEMACDCGECTGYGCGCCRRCCFPYLWLDKIELFSGMQGFTAPLNRGETGSFGFHYGGNWAAPVPGFLNQPFGGQIGYRGVSSNYSGASFSEDTRNQSFITAGLFRRVDWGLQGGIVVDILAEDWYYDTLELTQLRSELSWVFPQWHELGFRFTGGTKNNDVESLLLSHGQSRSVIETYEPTDLFTLFYRRRFEEIGGGYGRLYAGFTGHGEGLIGTDFKLPLTDSLALQSGFTYLIPKDGSRQNAHLQEAWNVGLTLVWYPGTRKAYGNDYFRPLFNVADNGSFIVRPSAD
ncbi:MAG: DUF6666 family protein [Pirellulaceae bacterium]